MDDKTLYQTILGLQSPWRVESVDLDVAAQEVSVRVGLSPGSEMHCSVCGKSSPGYDQTEERRWRHLDTCQYRTVLVSRIPRVACPEHKVVQVRVPWAEERSRFTALFESWVIRMLRECSVAETAGLVKASWEEVAAIQRRAVTRGLARRAVEPIVALGVDETSFQHHQCVTVLVDLERDRVLWVGDDRKAATLRTGLQSISDHLGTLKAVVMDMWDPYIAAVRETIPEWTDKIVFDRYHVMWHVNKAVDDVRRADRRDTGVRELLRGTRYLWLRGRTTPTRRHTAALRTLLKAGLRVGRAWSIKENIAHLWDYKTVSGAMRFFKQWYGWATRSRLPEIVRAAKTVKHYLYGVVNYAKHRYTNARTEAMNAKIQEIKYKARGYRNRDNFRAAILFHCGGLRMDPL
jgi:transposase